MKKKHGFIFVAIFLILAIAAGVAIKALNSPEYALTKIYKDTQKSGIQGLYPHMTEEAKKTFDDISSIKDNKFFGAVMAFLNKKDFADKVETEFKEVQWSLKDILKSKDTAAVILCFNYKDKVEGTLEMSMIRENRKWKISGFKLPEFENVDGEKKPEKCD